MNHYKCFKHSILLSLPTKFSKAARSPIHLYLIQGCNIVCSVPKDTADLVTGQALLLLSENIPTFSPSRDHWIKPPETPFNSIQAVIQKSVLQLKCPEIIPLLLLFFTVCSRSVGALGVGGAATARVDLQAKARQ